MPFHNFLQPPHRLKAAQQTIHACITRQLSPAIHPYEWDECLRHSHAQAFQQWIQLEGWISDPYWENSQLNDNDCLQMKCSRSSPMLLLNLFQASFQHWIPRLPCRLIGAD